MQHYVGGGVECNDALRSALGDAGFVAYCRAEAIKFLWRADLSGERYDDLQRAAYYISAAAAVALTMP